MISTLRCATHETLARMPPPYNSLFHAGDDLQRGVVDWAFTIASRGNARKGVQAAVGMLRHGSELLRVLLPGHDGTCDWQEMRNKVRAYQMFRYVDTELGFDAAAGVPAAKLIQRAASLDDWLAVWAFEGIGHYCARRGDSIGAILQVAPDRARLPLHAGIGTALADMVLRGVGVAPGLVDLEQAARDLASFAERFALPGLAPVIFEPLGLIMWTLYPHLAAPLGKAAESVGSEHAALYWHGVGRAVYFGPAWFVPCGSAHCKAAAATRDLSPDLRALRNAQAGLAWATTLANIRHPQVLRVLWKQCGALLDEAALRDGVRSALVAWLDMAPLEHGLVDDHLRDANPPLAPGEVRPGLEILHQTLCRERRLGALFRFRGSEEGQSRPPTTMAHPTEAGAP